MPAGQGIRDYNVDSGAAISTEILALFFPGAYTATQTAIYRIRLPFAARLQRLFVNAQTVTGTTPTLAVVVKDATAATTLFTSSNATAANTPVKQQPNVVLPANHDITLDFTIGGTTPSFTNLSAELGLAHCDSRDVSPSALDAVTW